MLYIKLFLFVLIFCLLSFIYFSGCSNNPVKPTNSPVVRGTVSGIVYNYDGDPAPGVLVSCISDFTQNTTTQHNGSFSIPNVMLPYDLVVVNGVYYYYFQYLNLFNPVLNESYGEYVNYTYWGNASIHITFNDSVTNSHQILACFFDSTGEYYAYDNNVYSNNAFLKINFFYNTPNIINGKVILLYYTLDNRFRIISFDGYRETQFTVQKNNGYILDMSSSQYITPGEDTITCDIRFDARANNTNHTLYMNWGSFFNMGMPGVPLYDNLDTGSHFSILVPGAGTHFKYFLKYYEMIINDFTSTKITEVYPGYNSLTPEPVPVLTSPQNNQTIDYTTQFSYTYPDGWGVYITNLAFYNEGNIYELNFITTSPDFTIPDLRYLGVDFSGENVVWDVTKFSNFSTLDEFLLLPYSTSQKWNSSTTRGGESFMFSSSSNNRNHKILNPRFHENKVR